MSFDEPIYRLPSSRASRRPLLLLLLLSAALDLVSAASCAAQRFARAWSFSRALGRPWIVRPDYPDWELAAGALGFLLAIVWLLVKGRRARPWALLAVPLVAPLALAASEPLYPPLALLRWSSRWRRIAALAPSLALARSTFEIAAAVYLASTALAALWLLRRHTPIGDLHGSSRWATPAEVRATGLLDHEP
jgi:hypothetical protein